MFSLLDKSVGSGMHLLEATQNWESSNAWKGGSWGGWVDQLLQTADRRLHVTHQCLLQVMQLH